MPLNLEPSDIPTMRAYLKETTLTGWF